jgi:antirestriction protein ArdC
MKIRVLLISLLAIQSVVVFSKDSQPGYSTCPVLTFDQAVRQNVAYGEVSTSALLKHAKKKVKPETPASCKCAGRVKVEVKMIESGRVVCATALNGPQPLQEAAVRAAMQWQFSADSNFSDVVGVLVFDFKKNNQ